MLISVMSSRDVKNFSVNGKLVRWAARLGREGGGGGGEVAGAKRRLTFQINGVTILK